jgi:hypothetical protein
VRALIPQHRGRLKMNLLRVAMAEPRSGLHAVYGFDSFAACEVLARRRVVLVYAVLPRRAAFRELFGAELDDEFRERSMARGMHGRR